MVLWNGPQRDFLKTGVIGNQRKNREQPDPRIVNIDKNTLLSIRTNFSPEDLRRFAPIKDYQLKMVRKIRK